MHGLRSIEYTGGTLLLVQCLKKQNVKSLEPVKVVKKREKKKKKQGRIISGCSLQKIILFTSRGKCAREATMAAVVTGGEVWAEV